MKYFLFLVELADKVEVQGPLLDLPSEQKHEKSLIIRCFSAQHMLFHSTYSCTNERSGFPWSLTGLNT